MKDFRDELLEVLVAKPAEFIDIKYLTDKYCGEDNTFEVGDETKSRSRLRANMILRELKEMGWINMQPQGGMSTASGYNHALNKRQFLMDEPVRARLTTHGEIEYKRFKKGDEPQPKGINITGDVIGSMVGSQSLEQAFISPTTQKTNNNKPHNPPKRSWLEITAWITGIIAALIAIWEFVIKKLI